MVRYHGGPFALLISGGAMRTLSSARSTINEQSNYELQFNAWLALLMIR